MIIVKLSSGLGNQMFQYAAARALSLKWNDDLLIDTSLFEIDQANTDKRQYALGVFRNIKPVFAKKFLSESYYMHSRWDNRLRKFFGKKHRTLIKEKKHAYNSEVNVVNPPLLMDGYWQSEKYFKSQEEVIRADFEFPRFNRMDDNLNTLNDIKNNHSVAVHVRRGDYVKFGTNNIFSDICTKEYFEKGIQWFLSKDKQVKFFFFSEDPEWIYNNLIENKLNATVVTGNQGENSWKDMSLMSSCNHHIISNSSFSWWAAWLNRSENKTVISPKKWFRTDDPYYEPNDIVPENWTRL